MTPEPTRGPPSGSPHTGLDGGPSRPDPDGRDNFGDLDTFDDLPQPPAPDVRPLAYRVRFSRTGKSGQHRAADVETRDLPGGLDAVPAGIPPGAYILSVEDLVAGRAVHWTRWPAAYRPGFGG